LHRPFSKAQACNDLKAADYAQNYAGIIFSSLLLQQLKCPVVRFPEVKLSVQYCEAEDEQPQQHQLKMINITLTLLIGNWLHALTN